MNKKLYFIIIVSFLLIEVSSNAQQIFKGGGTMNSTFLLGNASARKTQCIYLPTDLTNNQSGTINTLYYKYGSTGIAMGNTLGTFNIKIGQTTSTSFLNNNVFFTGLTTVKSDSAYFIPTGITGDWFPIVLNSPFVYNSSETLIIEITFETTQVSNFGCYGTTNNGRKLYAANTTDTTGSASSVAWQDMGFDLNPQSIFNGNFVSNEFYIYPNPANNEIQLQSKIKIKNLSYSIYNATGQIILSENHYTLNDKINTSNLSVGLYFISVNADGKTYNNKFIVQR